MAESAWVTEQLVRALQDVLLRPGAVTEGWSGQSVDIDQGQVVVRFLWRLDPSQYLIRVPVPSTRESVWTGELLDSPQRWAEDFGFALMEELDTGFVRRAVQVRRDGLVELSWTDVQDRLPREFYISSVPDVPNAGRCLVEVGLSVADPAEARRSGRAVSWLVAYRNTATGGPAVGQALVCRDSHDGSRAVIEVLEAVPGCPQVVIRELARNAVHDAAELAGARQIATTVDAPALRELGFNGQPGSALILDITGGSESR